MKYIINNMKYQSKMQSKHGDTNDTLLIRFIFVYVHLVYEYKTY